MIARSFVVLMLLGALFFTGCYNTVYHYETEKAALSIQAKKDASQPISGTFGLKHRVAVVVPAQDDGTFAEEATGDASSVLNLTDFDISPTTESALFSKFSSYGVIMTGEAAERPNSVKAFAEVTEASSLGAQFRLNSARQAYDLVKQLSVGGDAKATQLITQAKKTAQDILKSNTDFEQYHQTMPPVLDDEGNITKYTYTIDTFLVDKPADVSADAYQYLTDYISNLKESVVTLRGLEKYANTKSPNIIQVGLSPPEQTVDGAYKARISQALKSESDHLKRLTNKLHSEEITKQLIDYAQSN